MRLPLKITIPHSHYKLLESKSHTTSTKGPNLAPGAYESYHSAGRWVVEIHRFPSTKYVESNEVLSYSKYILY